MVAIKLKVRGVKSAERAARKYASINGRAALESYLLAAGNTIMTESKRRTPVDEGDLRASGYVEVTGTSGKRRRIELGHAEEYAIYVHERTELRHENGEAKFLQNAIDAATDDARDAGLAAARRASATGQVSVVSQHPPKPPKNER